MCSRAKEMSHFQEIKNSSRPLAVLNACHPGAWERVGGIPLVARTLFHLKEHGIKKVFLLLRADENTVALERWKGSVELHGLIIKEDIPKTILSITDLGKHFAYIDTAHLIDPRLIYALVTASQTTLAFMDSSDRDKEVIRAGFLRREDLRIWAEQGCGSLVRRAVPLLPEDVDPFCLEIRGPLLPYFIEVHSREEAQRATWVLIRSQQKQVMDLPAQFIDPPFENVLTRLLCGTSVTPNMVTFLGVGVGVLVVWLFWHGHFLAGALTAFLVEVLDGVDGKLARTTLHYTKLGRYEDLIDYFNETSWYVALGVGLKDTGLPPSPALLAGLLIFSDTADNILYTLASKWYGKTIDFFSPFDRAFRRIAGRRNIYVFIFIIGFSLGFPFETFAVVAAWAAVTASIHGYRLFQFGRGLKRKLSEQAEGIS